MMRRSTSVQAVAVAVLHAVAAQRTRSTRGGRYTLGVKQVEASSPVDGRIPLRFTVTYHGAKTAEVQGFGPQLLGISVSFDPPKGWLYPDFARGGGLRFIGSTGPDSFGRFTNLVFSPGLHFPKVWTWARSVLRSCPAGRRLQ